MSNSPTLPPAMGLQRHASPLPGLATEGDARLQAALAASARAEASLNGLSRSIQNLGNGVGGAREANESLTQELEGLRDMLGAAHEQQMVFKQKVGVLEQALERARKDADKERTFLIEQQDAFIVSLLDDQEAQLKRRDSDLETLRGRVTELERRPPSMVPAASSVSSSNFPSMPSPSGSGAPHPSTSSLPKTNPEKLTSSSPAPSQAPTELEHAELERTAQKLSEDRERARSTVQRLQAQRDDAQSTVARISKERDEALQQVQRLQSELGSPRLSTRPPSADARRDSAALRVPTNHVLEPSGLELEARLARPSVPTQAYPSSPTLPSPRPSQPLLPSLGASRSALPAQRPPSQSSLPSLGASQAGSIAQRASQPNMPIHSPSQPTLGAAPTSSAGVSSSRPPSINSVLSPPRSSPQASPIPSRYTPAPSRISPVPQRDSPPPEELRRALTLPPASSVSSSRPALKQKPDPSTRPLVGYSMSDETVQSEHLEGARLSSKPPGSDKR